MTIKLVVERAPDPQDGVSTFFVRCDYSDAAIRILKANGWWWNSDSRRWYVPPRRNPNNAVRVAKVRRLMGEMREPHYTFVFATPEVAQEVQQPGSAVPVIEAPVRNPNLEREVQRRVERTVTTNGEERRQNDRNTRPTTTMRVVGSELSPLPLRGELFISFEGETLRVSAEFWQEYMRVGCPLKNSVHQELVDLWRRQQQLLQAREERDSTLHRLKSGELTERQAFDRFPFWQGVDLSELPEVMAEFEALYRALEAPGKVLNHAARGCSACRRKEL